MQVYDEGNITGENDYVMVKWKFDFNNLFQGYGTNEFNPQFYNLKSKRKAQSRR